jgi:hypothetical protein
MVKIQVVTSDNHRSSDLFIVLGYWGVLDGMSSPDGTQCPEDTDRPGMLRHGTRPELRFS